MLIIYTQFLSSFFLQARLWLWVCTENPTLVASKSPGAIAEIFSATLRWTGRGKSSYNRNLPEP